MKIILKTEELTEEKFDRTNYFIFFYYFILFLYFDNKTVQESKKKRPHSGPKCGSSMITYFVVSY